MVHKSGQNPEKKRRLRPFIDVVMLALLVALTGYAFIPGAFHEGLGLVFFGVIVVHLYLGIPQTMLRSARPFRLYHLVCRTGEALLLADFLLLGLSGISMAHSLFTLPVTLIGPGLARSLHRILAHGALVLTGLHLGLRLPLFRALAGIHSSPGSGSARIAWALVLGGVSAYGAYAGVQRNFFVFDLDANLMMFANAEESPGIFFLDHGAILILALMTGHVLRRLAHKIDNTRNKKETQT